MGIRSLFDDLARRLATHGYAVVSPEPFARAPDDVRASDEPSARMAHVAQLDDDQQVADEVERVGPHLPVGQVALEDDGRLPRVGDVHRGDAPRR